ncbi:hypothetical protein YEP4_18989 [Yersinia enterocolitica subsp. palearctica YE-P4]|nr:hypothetical protein YWA314_00893 [Yersinia enterocolitica subsp. enterocolitica WA-314]EOR65148.1 hypothetical protein YE150_19033 [Yersinia enterocolitica subsp. palearctica YE-150]EOR65545.1 hypothetical protein YEP4_18989 [Yersinia enterocolitica subsp. palearctica YE-P4]
MKTPEDRPISLVAAFRAQNKHIEPTQMQDKLLVLALLEPTQRSLTATVLPTEVQQNFLDKRQVTV